MGLDRSALLGAIERLHEEMPTHFDTLNAADGKLGDGDLGITMTRGMAEITAVRDDLPEDLGLAMLKCSQAFTKSSGSSYGTLMALGMMAIAKKIKGSKTNLIHISSDYVFDGNKGTQYKTNSKINPLDDLETIKTWIKKTI